MTPAVVALRRAEVEFDLHTYENKVGRAYAREAADTLGIPPNQVFKTLIAQDQDGALYVAMIATPSTLNLKMLARAAGAKKMQMADQRAAERSSGYLKGGISPLGQKTILPTFIDQRAQTLERIYVSGGRRGLEIELAPADLIRACNANVAALATEG